MLLDTKVSLQHQWEDAKWKKTYTYRRKLSIFNQKYLYKLLQNFEKQYIINKNRLNLKINFKTAATLSLCIN
mgnify:CR=1 FL=1